MSRDELETLLEEVEPGRREFLKKLLLGVSYVTPIVSIFTMQALSIDTAMAQISNICSNLGELQIEKTVSPAAVMPGQQLTYTIKLHSCGAKASGVNFSDPLPTGVRFVSAQQTQGPPTFSLITPAVGSEGGVVTGTADSGMGLGDVAIFEIVVEVLP